MIDLHSPGPSSHALPAFEPKLAGRLEQHHVTSAALRDNPLGDPATRPLLVLLPPSYDESPDRRYPVVYVLHGFMSSVPSWLYPQSVLEPSYPESADALIASGGAPECIVVFADGWTSLGGSQYIDSPAVGSYGTYLADDVVGYVDSTFRTHASAGHRALQGKSSGGYGALVTAMARPEVFGAVAAHSPDAGFELSLLPLVGEAYRELREGYGGKYGGFLQDFGARRPFSKSADFALLECYALAACYSASAEAPAVELPFDPDTGLLRQDVWERWLAHDPVRIAPGRVEALASLRAIWLDAGRFDEHMLDIGVDQLSAVLTAAGIGHHHELYAGGHRKTDHRYPLALAYLAERIAPSA